ncbi:MAG TPA: DUF885 domain-containing protein, partial [Thermoplasmata archaeon]|nr:DUF885 domain-containing protein [Thermoplasmata archaeon]
MAKPRPASSFPTLARRILKEYWSFHPTLAAGSGMHAFDGRLPTYTAASVRRFAAKSRRDLGALERIEKRGHLSPNGRLELGVLKGLVLNELSDVEDQRLPRALPTYSLYRMGIVNYLLRNYAPFDRRMRAVARLQAQVPRFLNDLRATTDRRLADTFYEMAEMAAKGILDAYARELPEHLGRASPAVRKLVQRTNEVAKAELASLAKDLETRYKPRVKTTFALGRTKYERMMYAEHLAKIPVERLLEVGRADLKENRAQFHEVARSIDASKTPHEVLEGIERDHPRAESLIEDTRTMLEEIRQYLIDRDVISVPSEERAQVIETPRFYRFATAAMNSPGSFEKVAKEAFYYVTPVEEDWTPQKQEEWLRHLNYTSLRNISVHECYPGHYVHFLHRKLVRSAVLRSYFSYAFTEGWAHYCEEMMVEAGFGDRRLKLAQLQDALLRDCRYIASIGMHAQGWSWEDATRFFIENAYLDRLPAEREAKRGTWDPGYLNYTLGKLMIKKLRADWFARHNDASLREFHDALLAMGAPPLG